ncbi:hypothetical protein P5673_010487 [Acropora cervicornis]|uniref:Uncharacterized protein n=1 Tax=Acropora cervicornis TaxID=6130 RepID=A0AAD9V919_ACRCE|nr:hypothetical protein P5673_010487 [Acropora cervicornis]
MGIYQVQVDSDNELFVIAEPIPVRQRNVMDFLAILHQLWGFTLEADFKKTLTGKRVLEKHSVPSMFCWSRSPRKRKSPKKREPPRGRVRLFDRSVASSPATVTDSPDPIYTAILNCHDYIFSGEPAKTTEEQLEAAHQRIEELETALNKQTIYKQL